ncbi:hypothetical protein N7528_001872 [Penicillium herquei]|nr:hypothetical protein N7528_001872 [Penicillium herquei]
MMDNEQPVMESLDDLQLQAQGHEAVMPRQFTLWSLIAFAIAVSSAWLAVSSLLTTHLTFAGPVGATWVPLVSGVASMIIAAGLAELASAYPSSGGQYHYSFMVASEKYRQAAAFTVAWLNVLAWLFGTCSAVIYPAQLTMQLAQVYNPSYTPEKWQIWLLYVALLIIGTIVVIYGHAFIARVEIMLCCSSLLAFFVWIITLLAASKTKASAWSVFAKWENTSGWPNGFSFMLDVGQGMGIYTCIDSATHIAEEIHEPGRHVPRAMVLSTGIAIICNIAFTLAALFSTSSIADVSASSFPIYEIGRQAIGSDRAVLFLLIWLTFTFYSTIPGVLLTTGRLVWAFSRDNGLPWSPYFNRISERYKVPVQAHIVSCSFCILYGLIYIGSTAGFNAILSTTIVFALLSYSVPQALLLISGRSLLPERHFKLGKPIVLVGMLCFISFLWFVGGKRRSFKGPVIRMDILQGVNLAILDSDNLKADIKG